ncbi:MAG: 30S ribosomal protein S16 [Chlamydiae bacterium]|nr:30S ribosomal protein S16 [Chlamydiota bacterium]
MAVKIRMRVQGKRNRAFYRIVVTDSRAPRDGKYIESLGWYNPFEEDGKKAEIDGERLKYWLSVGGQMTPKVASIFKKYSKQEAVA